MLRQTLTILSLIGLLLSMGLLVTSYFNIEYLGRRYSGCLVAGCIDFGATPLGLSPRATPRWYVYGYQGISSDFPIFYPRYLADSSGWWNVSLPLWMPVTLFACFPLYLLTPVHRRRKRKKLGLCVKCGYDLRASKDICPECGQEFETT